MADNTKYGGLLGVSVGMEDGTLQGNCGEVMGTTLGDLDRSNLGGDEVVGLFLSSGSFEGAGIVDCDTLGIS